MRRQLPMRTELPAANGRISIAKIGYFLSVLPRLWEKLQLLAKQQVARKLARTQVRESRKTHCFPFSYCMYYNIRKTLKRTILKASMNMRWIMRGMLDVVEYFLIPAILDVEPDKMGAKVHSEQIFQGFFFRFYFFLFNSSMLYPLYDWLLPLWLRLKRHAISQFLL